MAARGGLLHRRLREGFHEGGGIASAFALLAAFEVGELLDGGDRDGAAAPVGERGAHDAVARAVKAKDRAAGQHDVGGRGAFLLQGLEDGLVGRHDQPFVPVADEDLGLGAGTHVRASGKTDRAVRQAQERHAVLLVKACGGRARGDRRDGTAREVRDAGHGGRREGPDLLLQVVRVGQELHAHVDGTLLNVVGGAQVGERFGGVRAPLEHRDAAARFGRHLEELRARIGRMSALDAVNDGGIVPGRRFDGDEGRGGDGARACKSEREDEGEGRKKAEHGGSSSVMTVVPTLCLKRGGENEDGPVLSGGVETKERFTIRNQGLDYE